MMVRPGSSVVTLLNDMYSLDCRTYVWSVVYSSTGGDPGTYGTKGQFSTSYRYVSCVV